MPGDRDLSDAIRRAVKEANARDLDEVQQIAQRLMDERNRAAHDDFHGLSPEQMGAFLYTPFDAPDLVTYLDTEKHAHAPIVVMYSQLADAVGEGGLKATAKGNLPPKLVRAIAETHVASGTEMTLRINREDDFHTLHVVRLLADLAGLILRRKGRFGLTAKGRRLHAAGDPSAVYWALFRAYAGKFNWAYSDGYPDLFIVQQSFLYSLRLLHLFGGDPRPASWYASAFLRAFPPALEEAEADRYLPAEDQILLCYSLRMERFASLFGLSESAESEASSRKARPESSIRKLPLLDQSIHFAV